MTFSNLAEYFEKLEQTSSRLILIDILAELFSKVGSEEISKVVYLIQGRVAPFYEAVEIGMAEKTIAASIAKAYGVNREEVLKEYEKVGDLGTVAERLSRKRHPGVRIHRDDRISIKKDSIAEFTLERSEGLQNDRLSVTEVFEILKKIAETSGEGTVLKKQELLVGLLNKMDGISAKHLVRIPLGVSRLGIGDPTILDGFALAKLGDRKNRKKLEEAYNKTSDLGLIGEVLWDQGLRGVAGLNVMVGRPIRSQLAERLPDAKTILEKFGGEAHVQYKYDGFRTQLHKDKDKVRIFSRNLEETTAMFPELIEAVKKQIKADSVILDAEALAFNPESEEFLPFQETTKRRRKYGIAEMAQKLPLKAFVFDIMYIDGKSLIDLPLRQRMQFLKKTVTGEEILIPHPGEFCKSVERIQELFNDAITKGLEGLLLKKPDATYEAEARNLNWVKLRRHTAGEVRDTLRCVMVG